MAQGFGGGEPEYKEALRRLKQECTLHIQSSVNYHNPKV